MFFSTLNVLHSQRKKAHFAIDNEYFLLKKTFSIVKMMIRFSETVDLSMNRKFENRFA